MKIPTDLLYTKDHEWVRFNDGIATVGITDFAQGELGDVVFVQMPEIGSATSQGDAFGSIEAVKAVADLYAPVSGEVVEVNSTLEEKPETINSEPYQSGWIIKIKASNWEADKANLLDVAAYTDLTSA
ncbi:glycine cleavage system protein GcvH [bacterium]|nr:glycine cleavage system protein GcvH [bacterium]MBU1636315.1 glycine cleavage system protein GcvH [bacterium]MBU1920013.1 glycine cleavage system protein GcvH [bacterium]